MPQPQGTSTRSVALVGHHGAGKTTLAEALLASCGAIPRQGSVDKGTTVCDFEPEEISRQLSVSAALATFRIGTVRVNLLDTPGYADFASDTRLALAVSDLAAVVVSATDGVQAQTEEYWRAAEDLGLPRVIVISKLDREHADFERVVAEVRDAFGAGVAAFELPIGSESSFRGVIDLLDDRATLYDTTAPPPIAGTEGPIPDDLAVIEHEVHEQLVEGIVVADDSLMSRYLDGKPIERQELQRALAVGMDAASVFPVLCCSGATGVGVDRLARLLVELGPAPARRRPLTVRAGDTEVPVPLDPSGPPLLVVAKVQSDQHAGRLGLARVMSGTILPDTTLVNPRTRTEERLHALQELRGRDTSPVDMVAAGDFVALPRLATTMSADTLSARDQPVVAVLPDPEPPSLLAAVRPASRADDDKLMSALQRLCEEDRGLSVSRVDETHQTVLGVQGEVHLAVVIDRLLRRFNVTVEREDVQIAYRETITRTAEAEGRYKKQSGGHGQFGVCHLRIEPLPRGEGFAFHDEVVGGAIPRQYIPAVEKGVQEAMAQGGVHGYPVVDVSVTVDDGKHHPVDSSELSFKMAGALAFRHAIADAGPVLLEPVSRLTVIVPAELQGDVLGDLSARRGRVQGTEAADGLQTIVALVPTAELARYSVDLRALTGGRGRVRSEHDRYEIAPDQVPPHPTGSPS